MKNVRFNCLAILTSLTFLSVSIRSVVRPNKAYGAGSTRSSVSEVHGLIHQHFAHQLLAEDFKLMGLAHMSEADREMSVAKFLTQDKGIFIPSELDLKLRISWLHELNQRSQSSKTMADIYVDAMQNMSLRMRLSPLPKHRKKNQPHTKIEILISLLWPYGRHLEANRNFWWLTSRVNLVLEKSAFAPVTAHVSDQFTRAEGDVVRRGLIFSFDTNLKEQDLVEELRQVIQHFNALSHCEGLLKIND